MAKLVAVVGMPGSGKGEVVTYLAENHQFQPIYFGGTTLKILDDKELPHNEENERKVREELREIHGMAAYAIINLPEIVALADAEKDVVIDGLYSWEEYLVLKDYFPEMIDMAVWAPPEIRYQRLASRPVRPLTREQAISRDHAQIENLHTGGPIAMADIVVNNVGELADLHQFLKCWATNNWDVIQFYR